jgi:hypothetical protein
MKKILFIILFIQIGLLCQSQTKASVDLTVGFGLPEANHAGLRIQLNPKNQIGLYYGDNLNFDVTKRYYCMTLDHHLHFGKVTEKSNRPVWFFREQLSYAMDKSSYSNTEYFIIGLSLGRYFNISKRISIVGDLGLFSVIYEQETIIDPSKKPWDIIYDLSTFPVLPEFRLQLNYSI